ncbi:recombination protein O N-terminal domain-containing protein [Terrilactibacillus sp. S3-3]|nr:recombination protein O N-terminal domain-containing protein [Terrilactibacillus sp. S3-3]
MVKAEGIVLRTTDYGETNKIITLYTEKSELDSWPEVRKNRRIHWLQRAKSCSTANLCSRRAEGLALFIKRLRLKAFAE